MYEQYGNMIQTHRLDEDVDVDVGAADVCSLSFLITSELLLVRDGKTTYICRHSCRYSLAMRERGAKKRERDRDREGERQRVSL